MLFRSAMTWTSALTNPMTTNGDMIYGGLAGAATRLAVGSTGQMLGVSSGIPAWVTAVAAGKFNVTSQSTGYSAVINDCVLATAALTVTLPTAVGVAGQMIVIVNKSTSSVSVPINTTSSQTIGGRASGDINLVQFDDYVFVLSDGSNWQILSKKETSVLTNYATFPSINGASTSYQAGSAHITLTQGVWRVRGYIGLSTPSGASAVTVYGASGFFGADGANNTTAPTSISAIINGPTVYNTVISGFALVPAVSGAASFWTAPLETIITVTSGTQATYFVPSIIYTTASTTSGATGIVAERIF